MIKDADLIEFLRCSAQEAAISVDSLLRKVLHVNPLNEDSRFQELFKVARPDTVRLLMNFDWHVRILNPGLHYVYRKMYMGYRREFGDVATSESERSQIFLCVVPRAHVVRVILPINPRLFAKIPNSRRLTGQGHHGVGNLQVDLVDDSTLAEFLRTFDFWLRVR
jgi:hypothetical protein